MAFRPYLFFGGNCREASRLAGFAESRLRLFGQALEWPYGDFDDRPGVRI